MFKYDYTIVQKELKNLHPIFEKASISKHLNVSKLVSTNGATVNRPVIERAKHDEFINQKEGDGEDVKIQELNPGDYLGSNFYLLNAPGLDADTRGVMDNTVLGHKETNALLISLYYAGGLTNDLDKSGINYVDSDHQTPEYLCRMRQITPMNIVLRIDANNGHLDKLYWDYGTQRGDNKIKRYSSDRGSSDWGIGGNGSPHCGGYCCTGGHQIGLDTIFRLDLTIGALCNALEEFICHRNYNDVGSVDAMSTRSDRLSQIRRQWLGLNVSIDVPRLMTPDMVKDLHEVYETLPVEFREWGEPAEFNADIVKFFNSDNVVEFDEVNFVEEVEFEEVQFEEESQEDLPF